MVQNKDLKGVCMVQISVTEVNIKSESIFRFREHKTHLVINIVMLTLDTKDIKGVFMVQYRDIKGVFMVQNIY